MFCFSCMLPPFVMHRICLNFLSLNESFISEMHQFKHWHHQHFELTSYSDTGAEYQFNHFAARVQYQQRNSQVPQPTCFWKSGGDPVYIETALHQGFASVSSLHSPNWYRPVSSVTQINQPIQSIYPIYDIYIHSFTLSPQFWADSHFFATKSLKTFCNIKRRMRMIMNYNFVNSVKIKWKGAGLWRIQSCQCQQGEILKILTPVQGL